MPRSSNETKQTQFRLKSITLEQMAVLRTIWGKELGVEITRADVLRLAVQRAITSVADKLPLKRRKEWVDDK